MVQRQDLYLSQRCSLQVLLILLCLTSILPIAQASAVGDADRDLFRYIHEDMESKYLDVFTENVQRMGDPKVYLGVCALLCAFGDERMFETGKLAFTALAESSLVTEALKRIIRRPRPLEKNEKNSFPSGHTAAAFTLAVIVSHEHPKIRIPLYIAAAGTAFSRVYLGRHYPSDVLAGAVIGTLAGLHIAHYKKLVLETSF